MTKEGDDRDGGDDCNISGGTMASLVEVDGNEDSESENEESGGRGGNGEGGDEGHVNGII